MEDTKEKKGLFGRFVSHIDHLIKPDLTTEDRRSVSRAPCEYEVDFVNEHGHKGEGTIVDISSRGLRLRLEDPVSKGMNLAINPPKNETLPSYGCAPVMVRVIWCHSTDEGCLAGLSTPSELVDESTWLDEILDILEYDYKGASQRKHIRANASIQGRLYLQDAPETEFSVSVLDLGMGGALIKCDQGIPKNQEFSLTIGPHQDLPEIELKGMILRQIEKVEEHCVLHPSRFRPLEERGEKLLTEYILQLLETTTSS